MKKVLLSSLLALGLFANAQVGPPQSSSLNTMNGYGFAQSVGTYTPLSASRTIWQSGATLATDLISPAINLPSPFVYNGKAYTSFNISNNGFITFGVAPTNSTYTVLSSDASPSAVEAAFAGFAVNLKNANTITSEIAYETVGNKVIVQFTDLQGNSASAGQLLNFQIQLDLVAKSISIVYGNCVSGAATLGGQVGIRGSEASDTNNRIGADWTATTVGTSISSVVTLGISNSTTVPASGLTFLYTPGTWLSTTPIYASLPFTENFSTWANGNSVKDLPNANNWRTWPARGDNSWRQSNIATSETEFTSASGWTSASGTGTVTSPAVEPAARFHSYNCVYAEGYMDLYIDLSSGAGNRFLSFDYLNPTGSDILKVKLSTDGGVTFSDIGSSLGVSASWARKSFDLASTSSTAIIRLVAKGDNGSDDIYVDNLKVEAITVPSCTTITTPTTGSTGASLTPAFTWQTTTGATTYKMNLGTTPGGTDVMNQVDLGNVTTYTIPTASPLLYGTTYYASIYPSNSFGIATSCSEINFTTKNIGCPTVSAPVVSAASQSLTPTIAWSSVTDATGYKISVGTTSGGNNVMNNVDVGNVLTYTLTTPLNNSTQYYYTVNAYTPTSNSQSCSVRTFSTLCLAKVAPYTENFDNSPTGSSSNTNAPTCWSYVETASSAAYGYVYSSSPNSSPNCYYLYNSSATTGNSMLVSPQTTNLSDGNKRVRFYAKGGSAGYTLEVGTLTDSGTPASYTAIGTPITLTSSWALYTVIIPAGTNQYLAFRHGLGGTNRSIYIDDVVVEDVSTCGDVTGVSVTNFTTNSGQITWTSLATAPANGYEVYYSTTNTAPIATTVLTPSNSITSTTNSGTITGLNANTTYYVWVRSVCSNTDKGGWSIPASSFKTECNVIIPSYINDFATFPGSCWKLASGGSPATSLGTGTSSYWVEDGFLNSGTTGAARINLFSTNRAGWLISPVFDLSAGGYRVKFNYGLTGYGVTTSSAMGSDDVIQFVVSTDGGITWTVLQTWTAANAPSNTTNTFVYDLSAYTGPNTKFAVFANDGTVDDSEDYDFFVDNFTIEKVNLGTSEVKSLKNDIKVYPNPFADIINLSDVSKVKSIFLIDMSGKLVKTIDKPSATIYLGDLNSGMYMVVLNLNDGSKQSIKAIKK